MSQELPGYVLWIILIPALAGLVQQFFGKKLPRQGDFIVIGAMLTSFALAVKLAFDWYGIREGGGFFHSDWSWFTLSGGIEFRIGFLVDGLTAALTLVVTLVSLLVFIFSTAYMKDDAYYERFYFWLAFFGVAMLTLTLADNLLLLFIGWELVGLCSYKLIGFWSQDLANAEAAKKAFITTRVGDVGMMIGILIIWAATGGKLGFGDIFETVKAGDLAGTTLTIAGVGIFLGSVGKSAQFPLQIWLPDAMAGPTPVSALIHAATMVAAGVYLAARMFPIFTVDALGFIAATGAITAFGAAIIAVTQTDIKKVLAYSTISQLGYMMIGVGCGAPWAGMFHLVTHAFFKACLFLGSGSVIYAMHHAQDLKDMGGLRKKMPITFWTFMFATAALAGIPLMSGWFSKDAILAQALESESYWIFAFGFGAAFLTAFYMTRMCWLCFFGKPRNQEKFDHAKESPLAMTVPLIILAVLSCGALYWAIDFGDEFFRQPAFMSSHPDTASNHGAYIAVGEHAHAHAHPKWFTALAWGLGPLGILVGFLLFRSGKRDQNTRLLPAPIHAYAENKAYMDAFYMGGVIGSFNVAAESCKWVDENIVDGAVNLTGRGGLLIGDLSGDVDQVIVDGAVTMAAQTAQGAGAIVSTAQSGRVRNYIAGAIGATAIAVCAVILCFWIL